jgi:hypothetical protein
MTWPVCTSILKGYIKCIQSAAAPAGSRIVQVHWWCDVDAMISKRGYVELEIDSLEHFLRKYKIQRMFHLACVRPWHV